MNDLCDVLALLIPEVHFPRLLSVTKFSIRY